MIHLDANVAIALLNGRPAGIRERFEAARRSEAPIAMSMIVFHELMYGAAGSERRQGNEEKIGLFVASSGVALLPFEQADAEEAADIRAHLRRLGTPIGPYDVLIAGQARRSGAVLVTANTSEFARVPGLSVVDWTP